MRLVRRADALLMRLAPPRVGPFRDEAFRSPVHSTRAAAWLGIALGVSFGVCFGTGMISHAIQNPPSWLEWPARPASLYRITQGVHVTTGIAAIPLLLAKLWTVYPRLWRWPPLRSVPNLIERVSLLPLVAGSLFMLFTGLASITRWAPWSFSFPPAHYAAAWITIGALVVHVGAKAGTTRLALSSRSPDLEEERLVATSAPGMSEGPRWRLTRRGFLAAVGATTGTVVLATVGQTVRPLAGLSVLAPRDPRVGPQSFPVNKTAGSAGVVEAAKDPAYALVVEGRVARALSLDIGGLRMLPQHSADLPIACVDGWSASATWRGVRVSDVLAMAGAPEGADVRVESLQDQGRAYSSSLLNPGQVADPDMLLALELNGEALHIDHGFPVRLIGPNRPGVQQTKWVGRVVVL